ncbi:MAG: sulfurtransferase TusA family protein [Candidatus Helarchaeota archaeon]
MKEDKILDCSGLMCPIPVVKTKKELNKLTSGNILKVISTDLGSKEDIPALIRRTGDEILEIKEENGKYIFLIRKS